MNQDMETLQKTFSQLLTDARQDERRTRAYLISAWLENLATHVSHYQLSGTEAAELLRQKAAVILQEAATNG